MQLQDRPRDFLAATGLTLTEFAQLLSAFQTAYDRLYPSALTCNGKPRQRCAGGGAKGVLTTTEDKPLLILVYQKTNPLPTMHALQCGLRQPQAHSWIPRVLPVLQPALAALGLRPEREAHRVTTNPWVWAGTPDLAIDGTERRRQRPTDPTLPQEHYSGKKKAPTDTNLRLVNATTGKVVYLGPPVAGKSHDKKAADEAALASLPHVTSCGRLTCAPLALSVNIRLHPARFKAASCKSGFWSSVETRQ